MFKLKTGAALMALVFAQTMQPAHHIESESCFPENDMKIPVFSGLKSDELATGITEEEFNTVLDEIEEIYGPVLEEMGKTFVIDRRWDDATVNASARQDGDTWQIKMYGGLARHEHATVDSFRAVACHELGHHLGGAPQKTGWFGTWASNEGQSDYFATYKCLKKLIHEGQAAGLKVVSADLSIYEEEEHAIVAENCASSFPIASEEELEESEDGVVLENAYTSCVRASFAGLSLGRLLGSLRDADKHISLGTPDPKVVSKTNDRHPDGQCRADTYFGGAICNLDFNSELDNNDPNVGTCNRAEGFEYGLRSLCWFKPPVAEVEEPADPVDPV